MKFQNIEATRKPPPCVRGGESAGKTKLERTCWCSSARWCLSVCSIGPGLPLLRAGAAVGELARQMRCLNRFPLSASGFWPHLPHFTGACLNRKGLGGFACCSWIWAGLWAQPEPAVASQAAQDGARLLEHAGGSGQALLSRSVSPPGFSQTRSMQNMSWEQHSRIINTLETLQERLKCRKTCSKDPLCFISKNVHRNKTFTLSPTLVLWAREAFGLFLLFLHGAYQALKYPDLRTRVRGRLQVTQLTC